MSQTLNINYDPYAPGTFALTFTVNGVAPNLSSGYTATMRIWRSGLPTTAAADVTVTSPSAIALGTAGSIVLDLVVIHTALALVSTTGAVWTYDLIVTPTGAYSQKVCSGQLAEGVGSDQTADVTAPISVNWAGTVGGDLSGTLPNPEVHGLRGRAIVGTAPSDHEVYIWHAGNNHWRPELVGTSSIANDAVTYAKLQNVAASRLLGRMPGTAGDVEEIEAGAFLELDSVGGNKLTLKDGSRGDLTLSKSGETFTVANDAVTYAKIQNVSAASRLLGRGDSGSGDPQEITLGSGLTMTGTTLSSTGGGGGVTSITAGTGLTGGTITTTGTIAADIGTGATQVAAGNHAHGNITSGGAIGSTDGLVVKTGTSGAVETLALPAGKSVLTSTASAGSLAWELASGFSGLVTINEQTYTGNATFTKNANCKYVIFEIVGGGGGGGNGTAGGAAGAGGCGGMYQTGVIMSADLGTSTSITVGAGGGAGADGNATIITNNTTSTILVQVNGGRAAAANPYTILGILATSGFQGGGSPNAGAGRHGGIGPGGGGAGSNSNATAGAGGRPCSMLFTSTTSSVGGGAAGGATLTNGSNAIATVRGFGEGAGGGGGSTGAGTAGNGGTGVRGSGGGGGGATTTTGGTGGAGGDGFVRIIEVQVI